MNRNPMLYKYKLNENAVDTKMSISGVVLTNEWSFFHQVQTKVQALVRTKLNPTGYVDYEECDLHNPADIRNSSIEEFEAIIVVHPREDLMIMPREELVKVALTFSIDTRNKRNMTIIEQIINKQWAYVKYHGEKESETNDKKVTNKKVKKSTRQSRLKIADPAKELEDKFETLSEGIIDEI